MTRVIHPWTGDPRLSLVDSSIHEESGDTVGTGVKNLVCHCNEAAFQFSSPELLSVQHSARQGEKGKSEGGKKVIKPTLNPVKAFLIETEFCFISTEPCEAPSASSESPFASGLFSEGISALMETIARELKDIWAFLRRMLPPIEVGFL